MKNLLFIILIFILSICEMFSEARIIFSIQNRTISGTMYYADVYANVPSATDKWLVAASTIAIQYNDAGLDLTNLDGVSVQNFDSELSTAGYSCTQTDFGTPFLAVNLFTSNPTVNKTGSFKICTIRWNIYNSNKYDSLKYDGDLSEIYNGSSQQLTYNCNTVSCFKIENPTPPKLLQVVVPTITTTARTSITATTATSGGNITDDGGGSVTGRGVCWSTSQNPTIAGSKTTDGTGTGSFTSSITGLTPSTKYYVRAYATNSAGTGYGNNDTLTTATAEKKVKVKVILNGLWLNDKHLPGAAVSIELRSGTTLNSSNVSKRVAVSVDSLGYVEANFADLTDGSYWLVIRATGYLPVADPNQITLSATPVNYDFTTGSDKSVSGANAMVQPGGSGPWMMRGGDFNNSRSITATDINSYFLPNNGKNVASGIPAP
jgi:hypothetical protein